MMTWLIWQLVFLGLGTTVSEKVVDNVKERFGLSATARGIIRYKLTGPSCWWCSCFAYSWN